LMRRSFAPPLIFVILQCGCKILYLFREHALVARRQGVHLFGVGYVFMSEL
jgi:hypothetical protein